MKKTTNSPLPPLYAGWFDDLLGGAIPFESRATCSDCAMCDSNAEAPTTRKLFDPQTKCCTYLPLLPNYLVGMILSDEDPSMAAGRTSVERRLQEGLAVSPLGLERPAKLSVQYLHLETEAFGRAPSLQCPHYVNEQGGLCGIWKYRNSVCSTWFCKYVRGVVGRYFWGRATQLLTAIEGELSRWCVVQLDLADSALGFLLEPSVTRGQTSNLTLEDVNGQVEPERQRRDWANWYGREREFYLECAKLVAHLTWSEVLAICGPDVQLRSRLTRNAYGKLIAEKIPERLKMGSFTVVKADKEFYSVYSSAMGFDSFQLSQRVMRLLPYFDSRPTNEIVGEIVEKERMRFTPALLRRLVDFSILIPVE